MYYCSLCALPLPEDEGTPGFSPRYVNHIAWHARRLTLPPGTNISCDIGKDGKIVTTPLFHLAIKWVKKDELQYVRKSLY